MHDEDADQPMSWPQAAVRIVFILALFGSLTMCTIYGG